MDLAYFINYNIQCRLMVTEVATEDVIAITLKELIIRNSCYKVSYWYQLRPKLSRRSDLANKEISPC